MMAKVEMKYPLLAGLLFFTSLGIGLFQADMASAGVVRAPKNTAETNRSGECKTDPYTIFGITWINDTPTTDKTDARWEENLNVGATATTVDATMWSTAYNCPGKGEPRYDSEVFKLKAAPGGQVPISFPFGTSIFRGDSKPGEFTDPPGYLRVRLNIGNKKTGCYTVSYSGTYQDRRPNPTSPLQPGASNVFNVTVCITRDTPGPGPGPGPGPVPSPGCTAFSPATRSISFSPQNVPASNSVPSHGSNGSEYYTYAADGHYRIVSFKDQHGQAGSFSPTGRSQNPFTIDYQPFIDSYPYDSHDVTVNYVTYYTRSVYRATGPEEFNYSDNNKDGDTNDPGETTSKGYKVNYVGDNTQQEATAANTKPAALPECYKRTFDLTPSIDGASFDDEENPTVVTFTTGIDAEFGQENAIKTNMRNAFVITTDVTVSYKIYKANGATAAFPASMTRLPGTASSGCSFNGFSGPATITGGTSSSDSVDCTFEDKYQAKLPPLQLGDKVCIDSITINPAVGRMGEKGAIAGVSTSTRSASGDPDKCSEQIVNRPYIRTFGGDSVSGTGFRDASGACAVTNNGGFIGYENAGAVSRRGAGSQLGVFATGSVVEFASAVLRSSAPLPPKGLTFSNSSGTYGGDLNGGNLSCVADYATVGGATVLSGGTQLPKQILAAGETRILLVKGDAYITDDVVYSNSNNFADRDAIPSFTLIALGNIYVTPNVRQLDGTFVAQSTGGDTGRFFTCGFTDGSPVPTEDELITACDKKLSINGSIIAQSLKAVRTNGTLRTSSDFENRNSPNLAESVFYGPESWLRGSVRTSQDASSGQYDAITVLPPVL